MDNTINYYDKNAEQFVSGTVTADMCGILEKFLKYVSKNGKVLDVGCGSGRDSEYFLNNGYEVDAIDASYEMCRVTSKKIGKKVDCIRFEDIEYKKEYDGIWACASLLHLGKALQEGVWIKLNDALKLGGAIYASYKLGSFDAYRNGRHYSDYQEDEISALIKKCGLHVAEIWISNDVRLGNETKWINVIAMKL